MYSKLESQVSVIENLVNSTIPLSEVQEKMGGLKDFIESSFIFSQLWYYEPLQTYRRFRDSSVGIATGYGLDDQEGGGSSSPGKVKNFHFSISSRPALGSTQPPIKWVPGALCRG
jgi:hypothetical protein